jgi:hypothetical protein
MINHLQFVPQDADVTDFGYNHFGEGIADAPTWTNPPSSPSASRMGVDVELGRDKNSFYVYN